MNMNEYEEELEFTKKMNKTIDMDMEMDLFFFQGTQAWTRNMWMYMNIKIIMNVNKG